MLTRRVIGEVERLTRRSTFQTAAFLLGGLETRNEGASPLKARGATLRAVFLHDERRRKKDWADAHEARRVLRPAAEPGRRARCARGRGASVGPPSSHLLFPSSLFWGGREFDGRKSSRIARPRPWAAPRLPPSVPAVWPSWCDVFRAEYRLFGARMGDYGCNFVLSTLCHVRPRLRPRCEGCRERSPALAAAFFCVDALPRVHTVRADPLKPHVPCAGSRRSVTRGAAFHRLCRHPAPLAGRTSSRATRQWTPPPRSQR